jgi:hypothetical protein
VKDPQQLHGYSYSGNTPVTASDPTGLRALCGDEMRPHPCKEGEEGWHAPKNTGGGTCDKKCRAWGNKLKDDRAAQERAKADLYGDEPGEQPGYCYCTADHFVSEPVAYGEWENVGVVGAVPMSAIYGFNEQVPPGQGGTPTVTIQFSFSHAQQVAVQVGFKISAKFEDLGFELGGQVTTTTTDTETKTVTIPWNTNGKPGAVYVAPLVKVRWVKTDYYVEGGSQFSPDKKYFNTGYTLEAEVYGFEVVGAPSSKAVPTELPKDAFTAIYG